MKKVLSITIGLLLVFCMVSSLAFNTVAAVDPQVLREYDRASDGDILFYADFKSTAYGTNDVAEENLNYVVSEDGRAISISSKDDAVQEYNYYGKAFEELDVPKDAKVTMTFKIMVDGELTDNKIGIGGWFVDQDAEADMTKWVVYNEYGVWQGDAAEVRICESKTGKSAYTNNILNATVDEDGFITVKYEYDASVAKDRKMTTYFLQEGVWTANNTYDLSIGKAPVADLLGVYIYSHYVTVDATIKDVKLFKGVGLTPEQIAITKNTTNEVEPTTTVKTTRPIVTKAPTVTNAPAAATTTVAAEAGGGCGGSLAMAAVAMIPAIATVAIVATKKKED